MALNLDAPVVFEKVMLITPAGKRENWDAEAELTIDSKGIAITVTKIIRDKVDVMGIEVKLPIKNIAIPWDDLRSLDDSRIQDNEFSAFFGSGKNYVSYKVKIKDPDPKATSALKDMLRELPEHVRLERCLKCGGWVKENVCQKCGTKATVEARKRGMLFIVGGVAAMFVLAKFVFPIESIVAKYFCTIGGFFALFFIGGGIYSVIKGKI